MNDGPPLTAALWAAAATPVVVLFALVAGARVAARTAAVVTVAVTAVLAVTVYGAGAASLAVAVGKGLWLGLWILLVVGPALLLYRVASLAGLEGLGAFLSSVLPTRRENLLVVAWVLPAFIQGVAGFGTPIAVTAPLLVAMGWSPLRAVLYPLVGYHWAVTFGSMGSSYFMASFTAGLSATDATRFAGTAAGLLAVNALLGGALVLWLDGRGPAVREGLPTLLSAGVPMAGVLVATALVVPAIASLAAGTAGLFVVVARSAWRRRARHRADVAAAPGRPEPPRRAAPHHPLLALAPYAYLLATALPVFLVPTSRAWVSRNLVVAPDFPRTVTGRGAVAPAVRDYTPVEVLGHPGFYILCACVLGWVTLRLARAGDRTPVGAVVRGWARGLPGVAAPIVLLATVATLLVDSGMVTVLAEGVAAVAGPTYPVLAPLVGATGSFMTGSTTTSNALFAALQVDVAAVLGVPGTVLLAAQTAGGNVGNVVAPVVVLVGLSTIGAADRLAAVVRTAAVPVVVLLGWLCAATAVLAAA